MPGAVRLSLRILSSACLLLLASPTPAPACTTFVLGKDEVLLYGRNFDFYTGTAYVLENQRHVAKEALVAGGERPLRWESRYGSVTFNQMGKEFPYDGMNEKGLVVAQMLCQEQHYSPRDTRPAVGELQWIQYQLDTAETVADVIASNAAVRITEDSVPLHFLVLDRSGQCAVIEHNDGAFAVYTGASLPYPVLANTPYATCLEKADSMRASGEIPRGPGSDERFMRAAEMVAGYPGDRARPAVEYAFAILDTVAQPATRYTVVYDPLALTIRYRTSKNREVRTIKMADFDFDCGKPAKAVFIETVFDEVRSGFGRFSLDLNRRLLEHVLQECEPLRRIIGSRQESIILYPSTTSCRTP
jgi:penicillin V acylase-like amidase (Ntn superfamily)